MGTYNDTLPLQPPLRLPPDDELVDAVRVSPLAAELLSARRPATPGRTPRWSRPCVTARRSSPGGLVGGLPALLAPEEALFMEVVRLFLGRDPTDDDPPTCLPASVCYM